MVGSIQNFQFKHPEHMPEQHFLTCLFTRTITNMTVTVEHHTPAEVNLGSQGQGHNGVKC